MASYLSSDPYAPFGAKWFCDMGGQSTRVIFAAQGKHAMFDDQFNKLVTAAAMGVAMSVRKEDPKRVPPSIWLRNGGPVYGSESKCATLVFSCPNF